jgi:hypothetical protein
MRILAVKVRLNLLMAEMNMRWISTWGDEESEVGDEAESEYAHEKKVLSFQLPTTKRQFHMLIMKHKDSLYDYSLREHMIQDGASFVLCGALEKVRWSNAHELTPGDEVALHQSLEWLHNELERCRPTFSLLRSLFKAIVTPATVVWADGWSLFMHSVVVRWSKIFYFKSAA